MSLQNAANKKKSSITWNELDIMLGQDPKAAFLSFNDAGAGMELVSVLWSSGKKVTYLVRSSKI